MAAKQPTVDSTTKPIEAEKQDEKEDAGKSCVNILLCILCEKTIRVPKCLPCLHSFCEPCLTKYVEKIIKQSKGKIEIICPECKLVVFQTLGKMNGKSYSENLPTGTICSSLLIETAMEEKVCHFNDGCKKEAVTWCGYCANALCIDHTDLHRQLTTMKIYHSTIELQDAAKVKFPFQKCVHHPKENVSFFCPRDWSTCCHICGKIQHKNCYFMNRGVMPIADIAPEIKENHTTKSLDPQLDTLEVEAQELSNDRQRNLSRLELQHQKGKDNIANFRIAMNEHLDQLEKDLNEEFDAKYEKVKNDLEKEKIIIDTRLRTVQHYKEMLEAINSKSTNLQAVTELTKLKEQTETVNCDVQQRKRNLKRMELSFIPLHDLEKTLPKMGSVQIKEFGRPLGQWTLRRAKTSLLN